MLSGAPCRRSACSYCLLLLPALLLIIQWYINCDPRSAFVRTIDSQYTANLLGALAHANQTEVTIGDLRSGIKTETIVTNAELHASCVKLQRNIDTVCARVLYCIVDCFLPDAQEICLHRR